MDEFRLLTQREISVLESAGCTAEDWTGVNVAQDFTADNIRQVRFYGEVNLGVFEKNIEADEGFFRHSGIYNATLKNVTVGDNCLIENVWNGISNYTIGEECFISNVSLIHATADATFGEGRSVAVLNEAGSGNVILFNGLSSNMAALMVRHSADNEFFRALKNIVAQDIRCRNTDCGNIGDKVRIVDTKEIANTNISNNCEVNGASRIIDCTLSAGNEDSVCIGSGVICESSIIADGSSLLDNVKVENCYVGESCLLTDGFTATDSLFFANCQMANGEACAAFCGPFSASHHKSTLLIGCMTSFYNAGSATNFSNHAYKMGPLHYGILERGSKTASGSHILLPATIGAFSVCIGKTANHPDTSQLPFSYIISEGKDTYIVPGRNLISAGFFRDINKWRHRDARIYESRRSVIHHDWLNPCTVSSMLKGKALLESLAASAADEADVYDYNNCKITRKALVRGIKLYSMALDMFIGNMVSKAFPDVQSEASGSGEWTDLSGLLLPKREETSIAEAVKEGKINSLHNLVTLLEDTGSLYPGYLAGFANNLISKVSGSSDYTETEAEALKERGLAACETWKREICNDAEKEFRMGDVERQVLDKFLEQVSKYAF